LDVEDSAFVTEGSIETVRYAPPGEYIKDHCLIRHEGLWHFFSIVGSVGRAWMDPGNEERIAHCTSPDLLNWRLEGYPVEASHAPGRMDRDLAVAPFVVRGTDQRFYMYYSGWIHPHRTPTFSLEGHCQRITMAVSDDLFGWTIPDSVAGGGIHVTEGEPILGRDPHVVWDDEHDRWLLYYTQEYLGQRPQAVGVAESRDLWHWRHLPPALVWEGERTPFSPTESSFVLRHPHTGKWMLFLHWHSAVSDDPLRFVQPIRLPFPAGLEYPPSGPNAAGRGWRSVGVGFAREFIEHEGRDYMSGIMGEDGATELGFTRFEWTEKFLTLRRRQSPS